MKPAKNTLGGDTPRIAGDAYYTPDALALAIAGRVREHFGEFGVVVEPSAGQGAFVRAARVTWPKSWILAIEPGPADSAMPCDELARCRWEQSDEYVRMHLEAGEIEGDHALILGNPPYNLPGAGRNDLPTTAERHVVLALDRMRDGDVLAFLLRLAFLGGGGRNRRLHAKYPCLAALWPIPNRPSFSGGKTDNSEYAVFVWRKGHRGPVDLRALDWGSP